LGNTTNPFLYDGLNEHIKKAFKLLKCSKNFKSTKTHLTITIETVTVMISPIVRPNALSLFQFTRTTRSFLHTTKTLPIFLLDFSFKEWIPTQHGTPITEREVLSDDDNV
jgi:hypothetical protein